MTETLHSESEQHTLAGEKTIDVIKTNLSETENREQQAALIESAAEVNQDALRLADTLRSDEVTQIDKTEIDGDIAEVATSHLAGGDIVKHYISPEGEITVIDLVDAEGGVGEEITITHSEPPKILVGDQPITTPEEAAEVDRVIEELVREAEPDTDADVEADENDDDFENNVKQAAEKIVPTLSPEQYMAARGNFVKNVAMPYMSTLGPGGAQSLVSELGISMDDFQAAMNGDSLTFNAESTRAFKALQQNGARLGSDVWRTSPSNPSLLGRASRESRDLLLNVFRSVLNK